jgi:hypothetical protein
MNLDVRVLLTKVLQSARFLTFDRRITECWSQLGAAVRTAQALGLHRDGSNMVCVILNTASDGHLTYILGNGFSTSRIPPSNMVTFY